MIPEMMARARAAVRQVLVGGVPEVEREGAWYEVEFSRPDGTDIEVRLDLNLNLVGVEVESD